MSIEKDGRIKSILDELHKNWYLKNKDGGCTARAKLLYVVLKSLGYDAKILRYYVKGGNPEKQEYKGDLYLGGNAFPTHVVVESGGYILDANMGKIMKKIDYERKLADTSGYDIEFQHYQRYERNLTLCKECKEYIHKYNLEKTAKLLKF